jgi:hypothetical protein
MIRLLADHNLVQQARLIWNVFEQGDWLHFQLGGLAFFSDVGLPINASDRTIWMACQSESLLLLTANRNDDGIDSLTNVISELNHPRALPVLTVAQPRSIAEFVYREDCAYRIADVALALDRVRGSGRLYIP